MSCPAHRATKTVPLALLAGLVCVFIWSGVGCHDRFTWFLEVFPVIFGVPLLIATYPWFRFTTLVYVLIAVHAIILMVGGHYTYALVPLGNWARDAFHLTRNHYDRVGHVAQGFVPAMIARELLLRTSGLRRGTWLFLCVISMALSVSALYELLEVGGGDGHGSGGRCVPRDPRGSPRYAARYDLCADRRHHRAAAAGAMAGPATASDGD